VRLPARDAPSDGSPSPPLAAPQRLPVGTSWLRYWSKVFAIADMEVRKLRHDPSELLTRAIQPMLWLLVFGNVFARVRAIPTGDVGYIDFLAPGILAQSVLFVAIFYGIAVIWERDLGVLHNFLAAPHRARRLSSARHSPRACADSPRR
jgi:ABC-2 type transport system permease protein